MNRTRVFFVCLGGAWCIPACSDKNNVDSPPAADMGGEAGTSTGGASVSGGGGAAGSANGGHTSGGSPSAGSPSGGNPSAGAANTSPSNAGEAGASAEPSAPVDLTGPPFTTKPGLFQQAEADDLGLKYAPGAETTTIFAPTAKSDHYSNAVALIAFKGSLYAQWQSSPQDEDTPNTWTAYSHSADGRTWSAPLPLAPPSNDEHASGGWWSSGDTLVAYINVYPTSLTPRGGYTEFMTSTDGTHWSAAQRLPMKDGTPLNGIFEQDPHALPGGRILNAAHFQPGLTAAPVYSDDPSGTSGWVRAPFHHLSNNGASSREIEPSSFLRADGAVVMVFRDQNSTYEKLAAMSGDRGATWTTPVETDMPDSRAKQSAGNLPDGTAFQVNDPVSTNRRSPLVVTLSRDGKLFDRAFLLRAGGTDLPAQRYPGKAKTLGYNYPKSLVHSGFLYVGYATNKEDVELTRVPLASLTD